MKSGIQNLATLHKLIALSCLSLMLTACGNPQNFLNGVIEGKGYIPYSSPMAYTGVGTIVRGSPNSLNIAAAPHTCLPDELNGKPTHLRWLSDTDLPHLKQKVKMGFNADLSSLMLLGTPLVGLNLGFKHAKNVELEFEGAAIEMLDQVRFYEHYLRTSETCRLFLSTHPIITQALRVNKMKFTFYTANGARIGLAPNMIADIVNIGFGVDWEIENNYTLTINTPKYIGYQVGRLGDSSSGLLRWHAAQATQGGKDFKWTLMPAVQQVKAMANSNGLRPAEALTLIPVGFDLLPK